MIRLHLLVLLALGCPPGSRAEVPPVGWRIDGAIAFTRTTACALDGGTVRCWGGTEGEGIRSKEPLNLNSPTAALCSNDFTWHTCALSDYGAVQCWGGNWNGQLGYGDRDDRRPPYDDEVLPEVDLGTESSARQISCGDRHTCALMWNNVVKCWGDNTYRQTLPSSSSGGIVGSTPGEMGDALFPVDLGTHYTDTIWAVACGDRSTCVLMEDGKVKCWGWKTTSSDQAVCDSAVADGYGVARSDHCDVFMPGVVTLPQLATEYDEYGGFPVIFPLSIDVFYFGILLLYSDGSVVKYDWSNGIRDFGPLEPYHVVYTPGCQLPLAVAVTAGANHDCVLLIDGLVKCWGTGESGQLGNGVGGYVSPESGKSLSDVSSVDFGSGRSAVHLQCGEMACCVILENGEVKCWGGSQLTLTDSLLGVTGFDPAWTIGSMPGEMGDNLQAATTIVAQAECGWDATLWYVWMSCDVPGNSPRPDRLCCREQSELPQAMVASANLDSNSTVTIRIVLSLNMTVAEFDDEKQQAFKEAIAKAAGQGVRAHQVTIDMVSTAARRLLAQGIRVAVSVYVHKDFAAAIVASLTEPRINTELEKAGLPPGILLEAAATDTTDHFDFPTPPDDGGGMSLAPIIGGAVGGAVLIGACVWWRCRRRKHDSGATTGSRQDFTSDLVVSVDPTPSSNTRKSDGEKDVAGKAETVLEASSLLLPHAAEAMKEHLLESTFLGGVAGSAMGALLQAGQSVPIFGEVFGLLAAIKEHVEVFVETEEESKRMSVWCVSLMALLGRLAQETQGDRNIEEMLKNAAGALSQVRNLVEQRAKSKKGGVLDKASAFWTASGYKKQMQIASDWLQKAIQALSLSVSAQTKTEITEVLGKVELLPRMDAKLDAINDKMDKVLRFQEKQSKQEKMDERRNVNMDKYDIKSTDCKREKEPFATGTTAAVFKARWERQEVAVKMFSLQRMTLTQRKKITIDFMSELDVLVGLRHPSVLCVYGVITDDPTCLQLVMEYAQAGELGDYLAQSSDPLPVTLQLEMSLQIAAGLRYVHSKNVTHRDLKSLNVLLDQDLRCKLSDFGLSKEDSGATAGTVAKMSTPAWNSPQRIQSLGREQAIDYFKDDVWAYGLVVWEIATRRRPWHGRPLMEILQKVGSGVKEDFSLVEDSTMLQVVSGCCEIDLDKRSSLHQVIQLLEEAVDKLNPDLSTEVESQTGMSDRYV